MHGLPDLWIPKFLAAQLLPGCCAFRLHPPSWQSGILEITVGSSRLRWFIPPIPGLQQSLQGGKTQYRKREELREGPLIYPPSRRGKPTLCGQSLQECVCVCGPVKCSRKMYIIGVHVIRYIHISYIYIYYIYICLCTWNAAFHGFPFNVGFTLRLFSPTWGCLLWLPHSGRKTRLAWLGNVSWLHDFLMQPSPIIPAVICKKIRNSTSNVVTIDILTLKGLRKISHIQGQPSLITASNEGSNFIRACKSRCFFLVRTFFRGGYL